MSAPVRLAVLMACHNRRALTVACLETLLAQTTDASLHLVVFDDGSTDGTTEAVRRAWPTAIILTGSGQAFWAGGMRQAFAHALAEGFDFYLWLNDDVLLHPGAVAHLLATHAALRAEGHDHTMIGGAVHAEACDRASYGGVVRRHGLNRLRFDFCAPLPAVPRRCDSLNGNVVLIPAITAHRFGTLSDSFIHTLGDLDYGLRVTAAGGWVGLAAGFVGTCRPNDVVSRWFNPALPLRARWRLVNQPLGFPWRPWLHFARTHGGPLWPLFVLWPYWRLLVPAALSAALHRRRRGNRHEREEVVHAS